MATRPPRPTSGPIADRLAGEIEARIRRQGFGTGDFFATEADLVRDLGVARTSLRIALRRLERDRVLLVHEGGGGGIYVGDDAPRVLLLRLSRLIRRLDPSVFEIEPIEETVILCLIGRSARRATDVEIATLRRMSRESEDATLTLAEYSASRTRLMNAVYAVAANPPLALIARAIERAVLAVLQVSNRPMSAVAPFVDRIRRLDHELIESIVTGDPVHAADAFRARRRVEREAYVAQIDSGAMPPRLAGITDELRRGPLRRSEEIAATLFGEIRDGIWTQGQRIGTDEQLATRFAVSRPTVREAMTALVVEGVVRIARGKAGGAVVIAFDPGATIARLAHDIAALPMFAEPDALREALVTLLPLAVQMAAERAAMPAPAHSPAALIGAMSGHPVLQALLGVLDAALVPPWAPPTEDRFERLVATIGQGDLSLARRQWRELAP